MLSPIHRKAPIAIGLGPRFRGLVGICDTDACLDICVGLTRNAKLKDGTELFLVNEVREHTDYLHDAMHAHMHMCIAHLLVVCTDMHPKTCAHMLVLYTRPHICTCAYSPTHVHRDIQVRTCACTSGVPWLS